MQYLFEDRTEAGQKLALAIGHHHYENPVLLALPRGGVVVADEIAKKLKLPLDVVIARKIGAPGQPELGIGALSEDEEPTFSSVMMNYFDPHSFVVQATVNEERSELKRRIELYRHGHKLSELKEKSVVVVDDGIATGVTAVAAARYLRTLKPKKLILAVPLGPSDLSPEVERSFDEIICLHVLRNMRSVGAWYQEFDQVEDEEVIKILEKYH